MPFEQCISNLAKALKDRSAIEPTLFFTLAMFAFSVQALTPTQVFNKVKDSVVVVKSLDAKGNTIGQGSGVMLPSGKIGTNCHVLKHGARFQVGGGEKFLPATLWGSDEDKDICLLEAKGLTAQPAQLGHAARLKVGEPVYAVGAPIGLELSLSDGIVSQLRGGPSPFIQTTAAISPGSSGGGLFDAEGRLVGFTTLYIEGGQSLNFAMPVEWAAEIQRGKKVAQGRSHGEWIKRAIALESAKSWTRMLDWSRQWTQEQPGDDMAWFCLGVALNRLERHAEAIEAYRQALRIYPEDSLGWVGIGYAYYRLDRNTEAIDAYQQALRIHPEEGLAWSLLAISYSNLQRYADAIDASRQSIRIDPVKGNWLTLGSAYFQLRRYSEAIDSLREEVRINPENAKAWSILGFSYSQVRRHTEAIQASRQAVRIDPENANAWGLLAFSYERSGDRTAALEAVRQLRRIDPAQADKLFDAIVPR